MKNHSLLCTLMLLVIPVFTFGQDIANSQDHPLITRYPGQVIRQYDVKEFDSYNLVLSVDKTGAPERTRSLEGKVTRINYRNPKGRSTTEILKNFSDALKMARGQILFSCVARECGTPIRWTKVNGIRDMGGLIDNRHVSAKLMNASNEAFISVFIGSGATQIDIIEPKPVESGLVSVNAAALEEGINAAGHVPVYEILFDTGKSTIKPQSQSAISEIATLLKKRIDLKLYLVGHTDSTGGLESNMSLSRDRATAVMHALVNDHGIAAMRLIARGVGPLAPVASNKSEEGRARNRRVDLVAQ